MKNILSKTMLLVAGVLVLASCDDDNDSNPTLIQPTEFVLNAPTVGSATVDLANSKGIHLTWSQPKYTVDNAPVIATYSVQVSSTGTFNQAYDITAEDNTGADYVTLDETTTICSTDVSAASIAKALQQLNGWAEDATFSPTQISLRMKAAVKDAGMVEYNAVPSNVVTLTVLPYYVELKDAPIIMWYLVGNMFGGKWGAAPTTIGDTSLPMFYKTGYEYDKKTGVGEIEYTNYFKTGEYDDKNESSAGFKIQPASFNWDFGMTGKGDKTKGAIVYRNGGSDGGHIVASEDGYWTITMNTANNTATMKKYEGTVKNYGVIQITGSFNGWVDEPMLPYNKEGVENHAWYYVMTVTPDMYGDNGVCEFKFKIAGSWDTNWGFGGTNGAVNYSGIGAGNASNLGLPEGKYVISFNDITGAFSIIAL